MPESIPGALPPEGGVAPPPWPVLEALAPLERALADAFAGRGEGVVRVRTDAGGEDTFPAALLLRDELLPLDREAVSLVRGRVLDVGAGAGAVALALQGSGVPVTALELLPGALDVLRARRVSDVREGDVWSFRPGEQWDTVLALMNGTALAGTLARLPGFLARLAELTAPEGQVLLDSTDPGGGADDGDGRYAGELHYQLDYGGLTGPPFPQLLVDAATLAQAARSVGLACRVVADDGEGSYLARLTRDG